MMRYMFYVCLVMYDVLHVCLVMCDALHVLLCLVMSDGDVFMCAW